jgi:aminomethyltransferase
MPVQYTGILEEHRAVRSAAGLFDVSHMGEVLVSGPRAGEYLDHLLTNRIQGQPDGKAIYSPMCHPSGGTVDDLLVYKRADDDFLLCVNASNIDKDVAWIEQQAVAFDCTIRDASNDYALLALQGPRALDILQQLTATTLADIAYYTFAHGSVDGVETIISRTGYTGEDGFELFLPADRAEAMAEAILAAGAPHRLQLSGLGARDSLRLEAGFPLYGHELSDTISPIQAGLDWTVRFKKPAFIGREALLDQKENGVERKVVYFRTGSRRIVRADTPIRADGRDVGVVLSGTLSPMFNEAIGTALLYVDSLSLPITVDIRGKSQALEIVQPPFYRRSRPAARQL